MKNEQNIKKTNGATRKTMRKKGSIPITPQYKIPEPNSCSINEERNNLRQNIKIEDIESAVKGVIKFHSENPKLKNELFQDLCPLFLQISFMKLPVGHPKILRIPVPHSILTPDHEVCLIVPEVKGIKNTEHEKHIEYYEELLRKKGVANIKKIMTCHELRTEYETFEQKSRLVDLYDIFLVDGKVSGKIVKKCGKIFYKKRKVPIPVKLQVTKLKEHLEKSLNKVFFFLHLKGDCYTVQFGHDQMNVVKLIENIYAILDFLEKQFHGGFENIKGVQVHAPRTTSIPVYLNFKPPNEITAPVMKIKKPKGYKTYKDELTTLHNAEVIVKPTGEVTVNRIGNKEHTVGDNIITDLDIMQGDVKEVNEGEKKKNKSRKRKLEGKQQPNEDTKKRKIPDKHLKSDANHIIKNKMLEKQEKSGESRKSINKHTSKNANKNITKKKDTLKKVKSKINELASKNKGRTKNKKPSIYK